MKFFSLTTIFFLCATNIWASDATSKKTDNLLKDEIALRKKAEKMAEEIEAKPTMKLRALKIEPLLRKIAELETELAKHES